MADGFGHVGGAGHRPMAPPDGIESGLLRHDYSVRKNSQYDPKDKPDEFWSWREDEPPPSVFFPLHFNLRRLRLYFQNQRDRFCAEIIHSISDKRSVTRELLREQAVRFLYAKPWYEFHALEHIEWIESIPEKIKLETNSVRFWLTMASSFSGELGRLVEQYYWKFRFEKAAVTGVAARKGASSGGRVKAKLHLSEHLAWQKAAVEIWKQRPKLSKIAVAGLVKKKLRVTQTAKHIVRFIRRP